MEEGAVSEENGWRASLLSHVAQGLLQYHPLHGPKEMRGFGSFASRSGEGPYRGWEVVLE